MSLVNGFGSVDFTVSPSLVTFVFELNPFWYVLRKRLYFGVEIQSSVVGVFRVLLIFYLSPERTMSFLCITYRKDTEIFVTSFIFLNRYPDFLLKSVYFFRKKVLSPLGTMLKHCLWRFFSTVRVTATWNIWEGS